MIISTEMVTVAELGASVRAAKENGCKELILLKCKYLSSSSNKFKY
jgi:N-acetylneuraminate synthase